MSADNETLAAYASRVDDYADMTKGAARDPILTAFIAALPRGGTALDLGCGPGDSAAAMQAEGLGVTATDASAEMVALAVAQGVDAKVATFADLDAVDAFDGIWASFSLLHAPKADFPAHLARIRTALRPGGRFDMGLKSGTGEERDAIGRFYAYYAEDELRDLLQAADMPVVKVHTGADKGLAGTVDPWIWVTCDG